MAAICVVDPLDHFLPAFVLEVDVDVGRLAALLRDEALEQKFRAHRIDGGDTEHIADGGIGGASPALAEDAAILGELDDGIHGQKVRRVFELLDQHQLVAELRRDAVGYHARIAMSRAFPGQSLEGLLRRSPGPTISLGYWYFSSSSEKRQRSTISLARATACGCRSNRRAISAGSFK